MRDPYAPIYEGWKKNEVIRPASVGFYYIVLTAVCLFVIMSALVSTASAYDSSFTAPEGQAIFYIDVSAPMGSTGTISFTQETGEITSGSWSYQEISEIVGTGGEVTVSISGNSSTYSYYPFPPGNINIKMQITRQYSAYTDNVLRLSAAKSSLQDANAIVISNSIRPSPVMSYRVISDSDVSVTENLIEYNTAVQAAAPTLNQNENNSWITYILSLVTMFVGFVIELVFWLKFFFIDNLLLIVALYIGMTGAMAFGKTKDVFKALKQFFNYQKKLFEFIISMWNVLIQVASYIRGLFKFI